MYLAISAAPILSYYKTSLTFLSITSLPNSVIMQPIFREIFPLDVKIQSVLLGFKECIRRVNGWAGRGFGWAWWVWYGYGDKKGGCSGYEGRK